MDISVKSFFNLENKTALITGASGGLGEQMAKSLTSVGMKVFACARSIDKLNKLTSTNKNIIPVQIDVNDKASIASAFDEIVKKTTSIDVCINAAGVFLSTPIFLSEDDMFEENIKTNLFGTWYVCRKVAKFMKEKKTKGSIINIGSVVGDVMPIPECSGYGVAKAAVIHLTKSLVPEMSKFGIRINCISPGAFNTQMAESWIKGNSYKIPLGFAAEPKDMEGLVLYLASNKLSNYVTGANYIIDGGYSWYRGEYN